MKITIKNVKGITFTVDAEATTKVAELKAQIETQQGEAYPAAAQTLIYKGKVLKDDSTVSENAIEEDKGFVVVMCKPPAKKPAAPAPPAAEPAAPPPAATGASSAAALRAADAPASTPAAAPAAEVAAAPAAPAAAPSDYSSAASALLSGSALETAVQNMCEMGFDREQVLRAMRAAFNNPERAVEYLMTGIPDAAMLAGPAAAPPAATGAPPAAAPAVGAAVAAPAAAGNPPPAAGAAPAEPFNMFGGPAGAQQAPNARGSAGGNVGSLDYLRSSPEFNQLRAAVRSNPEILGPMLQEMNKNNPGLGEYINQHQQEFIDLIMPQGGGEAPELANVPAPIAIDLSEEDEAAITRLEGMGFDRAECIVAFLACDKNEMLAANYLLENGGQ